MNNNRRTSILLGKSVDVVHECRRCGTTVDDDVDMCPYCGPTDVVRFEIF